MSERPGLVSRALPKHVTQSDAGVLLRAADMLTAYAELIRRDGATHVEEHHYLPDVEYIATELRTLGIHGA